jgi:hypothetical protein
VVLLSLRSRRLRRRVCRTGRGTALCRKQDFVPLLSWAMCFERRPGN